MLYWFLHKGLCHTMVGWRTNKYWNAIAILARWHFLASLAVPWLFKSSLVERWKMDNILLRHHFRSWGQGLWDSSVHLSCYGSQVLKDDPASKSGWFHSAVDLTSMSSKLQNFCLSAPNAWSFSTCLCVC